MIRPTQTRFSLALLILALAGGVTSQASAQADEREVAAAAEMIRECATAVEKRCYYPYTSTEVISRALAALQKSGAAPGEDAPAPPDVSQLSEAEAVKAAQAHLAVLASLPGQRLSVTELAEKALSVYCKTIDPYTRYESADDAARLERAMTIQGSGIGMTLQEKDGSFYCYPFPESSASLAGIRPGDKLLTVDGRPLADKSINLIGTWIKGSPGTPVNLRLEKSGTGRTQLLAVNREAATAPPVFRVEPDSGGIVLRIRRFEPGLAAKIREAMAGHAPVRLLTLDLRGNMGGTARSAVEVAGLFLQPSNKVLTILERGLAPVEFNAEAPAEISPTQISILQDEGTASASEILVAALLENLPGKAASQGAKTYGKGVVQDEVTMTNGSKLIVTVGMMFGPGGLSWNETGLQPSTASGGKIFSDNAISVTKPAARPKPVVKLVD